MNNRRARTVAAERHLRLVNHPLYNVEDSGFGRKNSIYGAAPHLVFKPCKLEFCLGRSHPLTRHASKSVVYASTERVAASDSTIALDIPKAVSGPNAVPALKSVVSSPTRYQDSGSLNLCRFRPNTPPSPGSPTVLGHTDRNAGHYGGRPPQPV